MWKEAVAGCRGLEYVRQQLRQTCTNWKHQGVNTVLPMRILFQFLLTFREWCNSLTAELNYQTNAYFRHSNAMQYTTLQTVFGEHGKCNAYLPCCWWVEVYYNVLVPLVLSSRQLPHHPSKTEILVVDRQFRDFKQKANRYAKTSLSTLLDQALLPGLWTNTAQQWTIFENIIKL